MLHIDLSHGLQVGGDAEEQKDQRVCFPLVAGAALHHPFQCLVLECQAYFKHIRQ